MVRRTSTTRGRSSRAGQRNIAPGWGRLCQVRICRICSGGAANEHINMRAHVRISSAAPRRHRRGRRCAADGPKAIRICSASQPGHRRVVCDLEGVRCSGLHPACTLFEYTVVHSVNLMCGLTVTSGQFREFPPGPRSVLGIEWNGSVRPPGASGR